MGELPKKKVKASSEALTVLLLCVHAELSGKPARPADRLTSRVGNTYKMIQNLKKTLAMKKKKTGVNVELALEAKEPADCREDTHARSQWRLNAADVWCIWGGGGDGMRKR